MRGTTPCPAVPRDRGAERGIALIMALMVSLVLLFLGMGLLLQTSLGLQASGTARWIVKAAYAADHNGMQPPSLSTNYYDAVYMIKAAMEATGVTGDPKKLKEERKKIAEYMANMKGFQGLLFSWDMAGGVPTNKPTYLFEIQDGKKKLVKEIRP
jgi:ABC-type branched-subunit amino acid transport system substrate-binding protein